MVNTEKVFEQHDDIFAPVPYRDKSLVRTPFSSGWFDQFFQNFGLGGDFRDLYTTPYKKTVNENNTQLEFNLAGYTPEEITVQLDNTLHRLIVKAESKTENNQRHFSTTLALNPVVQAEDITTNYKNGLLTVTIIKTNRDTGEIKTIPITTE